MAVILIVVCDSPSGQHERPRPLFRLPGEIGKGFQQNMDSAPVQSIGARR
jgi:hypothetical protein